MAVLIRDPEADKLIRELAARTGETITEAVRKAAEERLARLPARKGRIDWAALAGVQAYAASLPRLDDGLTDDQRLGYNDEGHFD